MSKPTSAVKRKYNKNTYRRYEFSLRLDSKLNAILERYKDNPESNISELIKIALSQYWGLEREEADSSYVPYHFRLGQEITENHELDQYFKD